MNVTELARVLKITPYELRDLLPQLGFHIGQKAIKVDPRTAQKIIKEWPFLMKQLGEKRKAEMQKNREEVEKMGEKKTVKIPAFITVRDFAALAGLPASKILSELMKNSIFASLNEKIDFETAAIIGTDLGLEIKQGDAAGAGQTEAGENKLKNALEKETEKKLKPRPPVIVVMGHVDHGKTTLLDAIRSANVVAGEAGGITQHIGAYQVVRKNRPITFIDTPGHEAFTAMRNRGAKVADIAILIVAADDGVKPQTAEAFNIIKAAKIPFIVAINKIDKEGANIEKVKQELANQLGIVPEDWGGKITTALISAKQGKGIDELLDMLILTADMEAENIKANPEAPAIGTVIESRVSKGEGPIATILVQNGTLRIGDQLVFNGQIYGKVRSLKNFKGCLLNEAPPSAPAKIIGLKLAPAVGDILSVGAGEKIKIREVRLRQETTASAPVMPEEKEEDQVKKLYIIIKSDVLGSAGAIEESLEKINTEKVKAKIVHKGLGNITDGDVTKAETTGAQIVGFNVKISPTAAKLAREKKIAIKNYNVIYHLINDVKAEMQKLVEPEVRRIDLGKLKVMVVFRTENKRQIIGGKITEGKAEMDSLIEVARGGQIVAAGKLAKLQAGKQDVANVEAGSECGIQYEGNPVIQVGDELCFYKEERIIKKI